MSKESLAILVSQAHGYLNRQWDAFESQDKKIAGLFALATSLITIVPTVLGAFGEEGVGWKLIPFAVAASAYVVSLPLHWLAYRPSEVHLVGNAQAYQETWLELSEEEVLRWTVFDLAERQTLNDRQLAEKQARLNQAAIAVAAEAVALVVGVLTLVA